MEGERAKERARAGFWSRYELGTGAPVAIGCMLWILGGFAVWVFLKVIG